MKTLLIADDSPHKTLLMQGMLHRGGWNGDVVIAATSEDAKKLIDEHEVGFAFVDFYIPSDNGPAIMRYLKEKRPSARVALVSSSDKYENRVEAEEAGAEACICTSYEADEVEKAFADIIAEWQA